MSSEVEYYHLAPDLKISRVITGLWQVADLERSASIDTLQSAQKMHPYVEAGLTTFDMADHYGSSEEIVGIYHKEYTKEKVQFLTKWVPSPGRQTRADVREAVKKSLGRMKLERLDMLQFHAWNYADPNWLDCLFWLEELSDQGLISHLGVTNFDTAHLRIVINSGIKVHTNQVCFSLLDQRASSRMAELCLQYGIKLLVFGTVGGGFLTEKWLDQPEPDQEDLLTWSEMKYKRFIDAAGGWKRHQKLLKVISNISKEPGVSMANVAGKFILDHPAVAGIIIGARLGKSQHIEDNLNLFRLSLADDHRSQINAILSELEPIPGDCGDEYRKPPFLTASGDLSHHLESIPPPFEPVALSDGSAKVFSGTPWEEMAGYCRATRKGNRILVSGTTATHRDRVIGGSDPAAQAHFVIDKIEGAINSLGGKLEDVVRTRIFIQNIEHWEPIARVHGQRFESIQPANTLVQAGLIGKEYLVEMEAEAVVINS